MPEPPRHHRCHLWRPAFVVQLIEEFSHLFWRAALAIQAHRDIAFVFVPDDVRDDLAGRFHLVGELGDHALAKRMERLCPPWLVQQPFL